MSSLAELEAAVNEAMAKVAAEPDIPSRAALFNSEMDRIGITDPVLKRELWLGARMQNPEALFSPLAARARVKGHVVAGSAFNPYIPEDYIRRLQREKHNDRNGANGQRAT